MHTLCHTLTTPPLHKQVFNYLHRLVRVSKVKEVLEAARRPEGEGDGPVAYPRYAGAVFIRGWIGNP